MAECAFANPVCPEIGCAITVHDSWSEIDMYVPRVNMSSPVLPCYFRNTKRKIQSKQLANDVNVQKQLDLEMLTYLLKMFI